MAAACHRRVTRPRFLHPYARPAAGAEAFVTLVRGEGTYVWDDLGNRYIDAMASLWYCNAGHGRAEIIDAITAQFHKLDTFHTFDRFTNEPADALAEDLAALAPMGDARVFFTSSGSEAVDTAIKLARLATGRSVVISRRPSYHGVTYGSLSATGLPLNQAGFGPLLPDVVQVPHDDMAALDEAMSDEVAAVIAEPVIGAGGVYPPAPGYLAGLRERCDRVGALLILDEVICGFGRLGRWWGAQRYDVVPDLVTFAKGVTSGYLPLGGVLVGRRVRDALESDESFVLRHGHTYSGHPAACAAASANIAVLRDEGLIGRADHIGSVLSAALRDVAEDDDRITDVRGDAGVWAVGLVEQVSAVDVREEMMLRGVIARPLGPTTITFCPPLSISDEDLVTCASVLRDALTGTAGA